MLGLLPEANTWALKKRFLAIGVLNGLNGILVIFSVAHTAGTLQALLAQLIIPFTLVLARVCVGAAYSRAHYAGVVVIVAGLAIEVASVFTARSAAGGAGGDPLGQGSPLWALVFALGQPVKIPCRTLYFFRLSRRCVGTASHRYGRGSLLAC